jgi:DNA phosphorothioation-associated putative methyltransferase
LVASEDLLVYVALARFGRRARPSELPDDLRFDIRDLFGSYKAACEQADRLVFAIADSRRVADASTAAPVGKRLATALYVHVDALGQLPPILRVLEGSARTLVGEIEGATLIKIHTDRTAVSYLDYPRFDSEAHPALRSGYIVRLDPLRVDHRDYSNHTNPAILHRKECFLAPDDARRAKFERLTRQEVKAGLYAEPAAIGRRHAWEEALAARALVVQGHRLVRRAQTRSGLPEDHRHRDPPSSRVRPDMVVARIGVSDKRPPPFSAQEREGLSQNPRATV